MHTDLDQPFLGYRDRARASETELFNANLGYDSDSTFCSCNGRYQSFGSFPEFPSGDCEKHPNRYSDPMPHFDDFKILDLQEAPKNDPAP